MLICRRLLAPLPLLALIAACASNNKPEPTTAASSNLPVAAKTESKGKSAPESGPAKTAPSVASAGSARNPDTGNSASTINPATAQAIANAEKVVENHVLCDEQTVRSSMETMLRQATLINGKGVYKRSGASTTYALEKPFRFLGLPVASVSFAGHDDPGRAAFWITVNAPLKTTVAALESRRIKMTKDIRLGYTYTSAESRNKRVEVYSAPKQSVVICARAGRK